MISSLANFLMLIVYHGGQPERVAWTLMMFTLGAVGIARVAIENDRVYSLAYAGVLGIVTFMAMLRFVDSPISSAVLLALIAYLADRIVRDCTLIDDTVDASGQGLIDSGRLFVRKVVPKIPSSDTELEGDDSSLSISVKKKTHQPGRTVMFLALAALPLFGLGQFFLRDDPATWDRAQKLLAFYLFASLSLLVTTSFLGLRRYLRQRRVEMPVDVSIAWLTGGLGLIAAILFIAFLAPLPGRALASFELPTFLDSPGDTEASSQGWGGEAADQSSPDSSSTGEDPNPDGKQVQSVAPREGAPPGDVGDGSRDQGPSGQQSGGTKSADSKSGETESRESQQGGDSKTGDKSTSSQPPSNEESSGPSESESPSSSKQPPAENDSESSPPTQPTDSQEQPSAADDREPNSANVSAEPHPSETESSPPPRSAGSTPSTSEKPGSSSTSQAMDSLSKAVPEMASLVKPLIFLVLAGIVLAFLWLNRHALSEWWNQWSSRAAAPSSETSFDEYLSVESSVPPRPFSSFRNPIGKEPDSRRIVVITFAAFEAWCRQQGSPRGKEETPSEFLRRVSRSIPDLASPARQLVEAYNRIVYGQGQATPRDVAAAQSIWNVMSETRRRKPAGVQGQG